MNNQYKWAERIRVFTFFAIIIFLFTIVLASCQQHELCYDHYDYKPLHVSYDWSNAETILPKSMFLYMHTDDGNEVLKRDWAGHDGGNIDIKSWTYYEGYSFNSDNPNVHIERAIDTDFLTTDPATVIPSLGLEVKSLPVTRAMEGMPYKMETDSVWIAATDGKVMLKDNESKGITLKPQRAWVTYHITIHSVNNWGKIASGIAASLSGLCGSIAASTGEKQYDPVIVPFSMKLDTKTATIEGEVTSFGHLKDISIPNKLMVYLTLKNGNKWSYVYDVTSMIRKEDGQNCIEVDIDNLPVPNVAGGNGGMSAPGVTGWNVIEVPIKM